MPVAVTLDQPGHVTAVIERGDGRRVCNLASEIRAQAGVLIAKVQGKPTAMLYRPVLAGADRKDECVFESPIGREVFASVTDITAALQFAEDGQGDYEISLELATVLRTKSGENGKWAPVTARTLGQQDWHQDKCVLLGDLGIIRGNGAQNVQRLCWNSLDTWMTSDIPSEARWKSLNWGVLKLVEPQRITSP